MYVLGRRDQVVIVIIDNQKGFGTGGQYSQQFGTDVRPIDIAFRRTAQLVADLAAPPRASRDGSVEKKLGCRGRRFSHSFYTAV